MTKSYASFYRPPTQSQENLYKYACCIVFLIDHLDSIPIPWLEPDDAFPNTATALSEMSDLNGLLAASAQVHAPQLVRAYRIGCFPWYSAGQPVLWWTPNPRTVLPVAHFHLPYNTRKGLKRLLRDQRLTIRIDADFARTMQRCAQAPNRLTSGTWITPDMVAAYHTLHQQGLAHAVEAWIDGQLAGGLYCVNIGRMVFGESMFMLQPGGSKLALAALVALCRAQHLPLIDCQQDTPLLRAHGAVALPRLTFEAQLATLVVQPAVAWHFDPTTMWPHVLQPNDAP